MLDKWEPGTSCVIRGIAYHKVWLAQSVIVVKDAAEETILLLAPGAQCAFPTGYWQRKRGDYSIGNRWQEARSHRLALQEFTWQTNRILMTLEPQKYYACYLFWDDATDRFDCYYFNFQLPFNRSHCGFDTLDLDLDIVVYPDFSWSWKDKANYQEGIREGGIQAAWVNEIEGSKAEVFDKITNRRYPLDGSWQRWKPDPAWKPPTLPDNWQIV